MNNFQIFGLQFALSTLVYALIARWYIAPILARLPLREALPPLLLTHALRGLGLTVLVTAVVSPEVPRAFATQVAYGDLLATGLALLALAGVRARWTLAPALVWVFNLEGFADLMLAFYNGVRLDVTRYQLGAAGTFRRLSCPHYWSPTS